MLNEIEKQIRFEKCTSLEEVSDLRNQYLDGLIEPQELYLELMVPSADIYTIILSDMSIGYFFISKEGILLEYFVIRQYIDLADAVLKVIIQEFSIARALCKSFDHLLLSCCAGLQNKTSMPGFLFREYNPLRNVGKISDITARPATIEDESHIIEINEDVFDHDYEVLEYINKQQLLIIEIEHTPVGFGIFSRVIEGRLDFDIGMLVEKEYRHQGVGQYIISYLADFCIKNGWRPVAGCGVENIGSRRTLEKAGFIADYRMLEFYF